MITIREGFEQFYNKLTPRGESQATHMHRGSIKETLTNHFGLSNFFRIGSHENGTAISGSSHSDYLAVIHPRDLSQDSGFTLRKIYEALSERFPTTRGIRIEPPAVIVPFGFEAQETTKVIPAEFLRRKSDCSIYEIPNRHNGWMIACPKAHYDYMTLANLKRSLRTKPLVRFIKAIKLEHKLAINSFYIEIFIARFALSKEEINFPDDIWRVLKMFSRDELAAIHDPLKISGELFACQIEDDKRQTLSKLDRILSEIEEAVRLEDKGKLAKSFSQWQKVFGKEFPRYR